MRIHENQSEEEQINLMPLIDMVFLLLIFFLVATTIAAEERDHNIQLPTSGAPRALSAPPEQFIVNIDAEGNYKVNGQFREEEQVQAALKKLAEENEQKIAQGRKPIDVLMRVDAESRHKHFAAVTAMCHEVGISAVNIGYVQAKIEE